MLVKRFAFNEDEVELMQRMLVEEIRCGHVTTDVYDPTEDLRTLLALNDQLGGKFERKEIVRTNPKNKKDDKDDKKVLVGKK